MVEFTDEAVIPASIEDAFRRALSIDAHEAAFRASHERAVAGVTSGVIGLEEQVTWRARHFGVMWTMTSRITELDRPHRFVDEQARGPFRRFRHEHTFESVEGGTLMRDRVTFEAPFGLLGRLAERLVLARYMRHLIAVRNEFLAAPEVAPDPASGIEPPMRFAMRFEPVVSRWSRWFGGTRSTAWVDVSTSELLARFGPWQVRTPRTNIVSASITGPYQAWKVAGPPRVSYADRGVTFGTSRGPGVCLGFAEPVTGALPFGLLRHPSLTVTVDDPRALIEHLGPLPDAVPVHVTRAKGSLIGVLRGIRSWTNRSTVRVRRRFAEKIVVPDQASDERPDGQPVQSGVGALFHRTYVTTVCGASIDANRAMARIQADPNVISAPAMAPFVKERGEPGRMALGDRYVLETAGPWRAPVEVVEIDDRSFRFATLDGHMEAGLIEFRVESDDPGSLSLVIESWARSGGRAFDAVYDKLHLGKAVQSETWAVAGERFVELTGGSPRGPTQITEERST